MSTTPTIQAYKQIPNKAVIAANNFKFKSLSDWSYNIAVGCRHGCTFCYVPSTSGIKQETNLEKQEGLVPQEWIKERSEGKHWGDWHWGDYAFVREWDEKAFRASLQKAQRERNAGKLTPDGNAAIMFCTTTDPYQALGGPNAGILKELLKKLVRDALTIILEESDLNVRILTRSPVAIRDFDIYKKFAEQNRILFGMSLPTFDPSLKDIYEPHAPSPEKKFETLEKAVKEGIPVYVAMAPTLPDEGESELRETIKKIMTLNPVTLFHEPINLRAENLARIEAKAHSLGRSIRSEVFRTRERWREYAFEQFALVDKLCDELNVPDGVLHQWPDKVLGSKAGFLKMKRAVAEREKGAVGVTKKALENHEEEWREHHEPWIKYWQNPKERISAWPPVKPSTLAASVRPRLGLPTNSVPELTPEDASVLEALEKQVENSFLATCQALWEIKSYKDGVLWKDRYTTFPEYAKARFNYREQHAYRLLAAGNFVHEIVAVNNSSQEKDKLPLPEKEIQVRHIINKIPENRRLQCWQGITRKCSPSELTGVAIETEVIEFEKSLPKEELKTKARKRKGKAGIDKIKKTSLPLIGRLKKAISAHPEAQELLKHLVKIEELIG